MSAREKLNSASFLGALAVASLVGGLSQSWAVFFVALAGLLIAALLARDIRFKRKRRRQ
jgi:hypothetical protein